jgi:hypothetical protein
MCWEIICACPGFWSRLHPTMFSLFSSKAVRLLLSVGVSIWIAGGCLFGCTGTVAGAEHEPQTVVEGHSCHAAQQKNIAAHAQQQPKGVPSFAPAPRGIPKDCPLAVSSTAATSKNSGHVPDPGRAPVFALPLIEKTFVPLKTSVAVGFLPNRGPTHLRCCVFLI